MSSEIVLAEPLYDHGHVPEPFDSERLPVTLGSEIPKFLRVANQLEVEEPRVAYLCRFHAFGKAHIMDGGSTGRGVRQFKIALLKRIDQDMEVTVERRKAKSDESELRRVYNGYKDYIIRHTGTDDFAYREKLINARAIACVLFEVLQTFTSEAGHQALADRDNLETNSEEMADDSSCDSGELVAANEEKNKANSEKFNSFVYGLLTGIALSVYFMYF